MPTPAPTTTVPVLGHWDETSGRAGPGVLAEVTLAPHLVRTWWRQRPAPVRRLATAAGTLVVLGIVVVVCSGSWWSDPIKAALEAIGDWIAGVMADAIAGPAEQLMSLAFNNPLTEISSGQWEVATRQASRWGAVFAIVAVGMCAVEVVAGLIVRDTARVLRAGMTAALAWPITVAAILLLAELVAVTDGLAGQMFDNVDGGGVIGTTAAGTAMGAALGGITALTVGGGWPVVVLGALVCLIGLLLLTMVMAARAFGLLVATGFAPTALMLMGFKGTRGMAAKWVEIVLGLLLTKPLAAGIIVLCLELAGEGGLASFIMGTVGLWVAIFSPALAMSLVSFAGGHLSAALTAHASALKGLGAQAAQAGATKLALEGPNSEALSKLGSDAAGLAKAGVSGLDKMFTAMGERLNRRSEEPQDGDAPGGGEQGDQVEDTDTPTGGEQQHDDAPVEAPEGDGGGGDNPPEPGSDHPPVEDEAPKDTPVDGAQESVGDQEAGTDPGDDLPTGDDVTPDQSTGGPVDPPAAGTPPGPEGTGGAGAPGAPGGAGSATSGTGATAPGSGSGAAGGFGAAGSDTTTGGSSGGGSGGGSGSAGADGSRGAGGHEGGPEPVGGSDSPTPAPGPGPAPRPAPGAAPGGAGPAAPGRGPNPFGGR
ncbi:hypothetical protein [Cellulomonas triticagri]|uniref:TrbL/VirB6 plasmid conjugal transfer protein n=1 Tax=Cellulomonas triticagri TaxID=2483352 RepID=A0A3M2IZA8_9CELL|nr:hypothetical protein [Cellulomonas triticagri]RMI03728.1 hypothetical protein EBM89_18590 [Cellulomonas triticagri]